MNFFRSDLSRNFGIGFLLGAVLVAVAAGPQWRAELAPAAFASVVEAPAAE